MDLQQSLGLLDVVVVLWDGWWELALSVGESVVLIGQVGEELVESSGLLVLSLLKVVGSLN